MRPVTADTTDEARGRAVFVEADRRERGYVDLEVNLEMILGNAAGTESRRLLRIRQLEVPDDGDKLLVVFDTPKTIRGTAFLSFSYKTGTDDQWLYLPASKRVKRIASKNKSGPFLSSEFAFEDLSAQEVEKFTYRYSGEGEAAELPCFVVERVPKDEHSGYRRQLVWLDQAEYRIQKIEYYNKRDELTKTLTYGGYQKHLGQFWRPATMFMVNHKDGKTTELIWHDYRFRNGFIAERDFSATTLKRVY
ncbi:MAG: outer membrane lipoprotein-sorting protein [Proteobacteria bacterium]|nr:outer membrane lipoprotein-sorting protein [Pseudomonadota bacterium]